MKKLWLGMVVLFVGALVACASDESDDPVLESETGSEAVSVSEAVVEDAVYVAVYVSDTYTVAFVEAEALIGTWSSQFDEEYLLIFDADGTGVRGYVIEDIDYFLEELAEGIGGQDLLEDAFEEFGGRDEFVAFLLTGMVESFEWEVSEDVLHVELEFFNEEWQVSIEGDVLTIESLQIPDVSYRYTRR